MLSVAIRVSENGGKGRLHQTVRPRIICAVVTLYCTICFELHSANTSTSTCRQSPALATPAVPAAKFVIDYPTTEDCSMTFFDWGSRNLTMTL